MTDDLHMLPATELVAHYRDKKLSPIEVTEAALARIGAHNEAVNAFVRIEGDMALASAKESEARWAKGEPAGPVDGVPTTIKDVTLAKGWPTLRGSKAVDPEGPWDDDAPATARLRESGAVLLGKTTTPEFGWKGVTDSPLTGITRNPWNTSRTPGGSSGGAVASAALGFGALHIGTDGGGSIRIPSGFTGVFGIKPNFGRVPAWPASPFGTLSHTGPIARTVPDAALMLNVISRPDTRDWQALPYDGRDYLDGLEDGVKGLKIAFSLTLGYVDIVDPEISELVTAAVRVFEDLGAEVEEVDPGFQSPYEMFRTHWYVGAAKLMEGIAPEKRELMEEGTREIAAEGAKIPLLDYLGAVAGRAALGEHMCKFHQTYDLLMTPSLPIPAFAAGIEMPDSDDQERWSEWTPFTYPFNLTQQPAASVPCGFTAEGLPAGLQIVGPMHGEALVLRAARAYEQLHPFQMPDAPR